MKGYDSLSSSRSIAGSIILLERVRSQATRAVGRMSYLHLRIKIRRSLLRTFVALAATPTPTTFRTTTSPVHEHGSTNKELADGESKPWDRLRGSGHCRGRGDARSQGSSRGRLGGIDDNLDLHGAFCGAETSSKSARNSGRESRLCYQLAVCGRGHNKS